MVPLLPVWVISSFCACILSYFLSFLPLLRKNFPIKGFFNFCVVATHLITSRKPEIGQATKCLTICLSRDANICLQGLKDIISTFVHTYTDTVAPARCNIVTVVNHSCAHPCVFPLWLKGDFTYIFLHYTFLKHESLFSACSQRKSNTGSFPHTLSERKTCMNSCFTSFTIL